MSLERIPVEYWNKRLKKGMDRCMGCQDVTEMMLNMVLNIIESNLRYIGEKLHFLPARSRPRCVVVVPGWLCKLDYGGHGQSEI